MSELVVGSIAGLAANSYEVSVASGSTLDLANAKAGSLPASALASAIGATPVLIGTATGVASVSFDNVFTSAFKNYVIYGEVTPTSAQPLLRLRSGGSTATTGYNTSNAYNNGTGWGQGQATTEAGSFGGSGAIKSATQFVLMGPQVAETTVIYGNGTNTTPAGYPYMVVYSSTLQNTTQYDGFTAFVSSGTFSGRFQVFGFSDVEV